MLLPSPSLIICWGASLSAQTGPAAAAIVDSLNGATLGTGAASAFQATYPYLAAQLILAANVNTTTPNLTLVNDIALSTSTDSTIDAATTNGKDGFVTELSNQLGSSAHLKYLGSIVTYLAASKAFTDTEIAADIAASGGVILYSTAASTQGQITTASITETGTLTAILTGSNQADATKIAYAAANGTGILSGTSGDATREQSPWMYSRMPPSATTSVPR